MRIVINHLTRMQPGLMCVAGIDPVTGLHVRPVLGRPLPVEYLGKNGGPFNLGRLVDLGETTFVGRMPEIEDRSFQAEGVTVVDEWETSRWLGLCATVAKTKLVDVFGNELKTIENRFGAATAAVPERSGLRSLGCYWANEVKLTLAKRLDRSTIRLEFLDVGIRYSVAVTDIRLWNDCHTTPNPVEFAKMEQAIINSDAPILLSVGLSRAHRFTDNSPPRHWLQVNNIHMGAWG